MVGTLPFIIDTKECGGPLSGRMLVLHLSIIMGAVISFMVVRKFPQFFTPDNLWGSVLVSVPFLLLKAYMDRRLEIADQMT